MASSIATRIVAGSALLLVATQASPALAEPSKAEAALAQQSFDEARTLFAAGQVHEACDKFAESQRLDPREGTLLNLAICHEKEGKIASAWVEYSDGLATARAEGKEARVKFAADHVAQLAPRLSHLRVTVAPEARVAGFVLLLDGAPLRELAWGTDLPIDPGAHTIEASAPHHASFRGVATVGASADRQVMDVPALASADSLAAAHAPEPLPVAEDGAFFTTKRTAGVVAGGVGLASGGVAAIFGVMAISERHDAAGLCAQGSCGAPARSDNSAGLRDAWISDIGFGVAIIGVAVGTYLILTGAPAAPAPTGRAGFVVTARGASLGWTFE